MRSAQPELCGDEFLSTPANFGANNGRYAVAPPVWFSWYSSGPICFCICSSYAYCSFFALRTGSSSAWLGGNTNVCTKLSRSILSLFPTTCLWCSLQKSQKSFASMSCLLSRSDPTSRHFSHPRSIHLCTSLARTCNASARACFVNQSCPMRALAPNRCNIDRTEADGRCSSSVTSSSE